LEIDVPVSANSKLMIVVLTKSEIYRVIQYTQAGYIEM